jgi:inner membrane protein
MVKDGMPSPVGHALAGLAAAWAADLVPGRRSRCTAPSRAPFISRAGGTLTLACVALAVLPDLDLAFQAHRSLSHSVGAVVLVTIITAAVTAWVTRRHGSERRFGILRVSATCGLAYATHLVLDWLAIDTREPFGLQALWPFSQEWFISGANLFPRTERRAILSLPSIRTNLNALAWETAIMLPIVVLLWRIRVKTLAGLAAEVSRRDHAP